MLVDVKCSKCGESSKLDTADMSQKEVQKWLDKSGDGFQCFGNHVELCERSRFWTVDWSTMKEGSGPTDEEFVEKLKLNHKEVYKNKDLDTRYKVTGFSYGMCITEDKQTGETACFDFTRSPSGERYYYI